MERLSGEFLSVGCGASFAPERVRAFLKLKVVDVSRLTSVDARAVRFDDLMPTVIRECLEEFNDTINMVARRFDGDLDKTSAWFKAKNPLLGDISPRDMIRLGRHNRLRRFVIDAIAGGA
jgi:hypothetical protein